MAEKTVSSGQMCGKNVFVTVGTTEFDELIKSVTSPEVCKVLRQLGYTRMLLQTGRGQFPLEDRDLSDLSPSIQHYRFKDSITSDVIAADLVISHAGAGSVMEVLTANKALMVVINEQLMGNHQQELAQHLQSLHHLFYCTCRTLKDTLQGMDLTTLQAFTPGHPTLLHSHLDRLVRQPSSVSGLRLLVCHLTWLCLVALMFVVWPLGAVVVVLCGVVLLLVCVGGGDGVTLCKES